VNGTSCYLVHGRSLQEEDGCCFFFRRRLWDFRRTTTAASSSVDEIATETAIQNFVVHVMRVGLDTLGARSGG
jgi:hypothetical protein